ncbi:hypothetical protein [Bacillus sp. MUM 13]|uniref:hypothetical protein n=1 Tax=Bacillus sp. MUM 13 TaxID=1678001 RepID=UPI00147F1408|nr:hypothetical protein [Bacillus sp. MUM 13]
MLMMQKIEMAEHEEKLAAEGAGFSSGYKRPEKNDGAAVSMIFLSSLHSASPIV